MGTETFHLVVSVLHYHYIDKAPQRWGRKRFKRYFHLLTPYIDKAPQRWGRKPLAPLLITQQMQYIDKAPQRWGRKPISKTCKIFLRNI